MWKDRVREELRELSEKLDRLNVFIRSNEFVELPDDTRYWLLRQKLAMMEYATILQCRLA
jgi:hypothetical protein